MRTVGDVTRSFLALSLIVVCLCEIKAADTFPELNDSGYPSDLAAIWSGLDPAAEPLETEVLKQWEEDGVSLRVVRFQVGVLKGHPASVAAVYGFPSTSAGLPGLVQIHGGGQYADAKACIANAKRGDAMLSITWAGRISSSQYRVNPEIVKLFWDKKTDAPGYRLTTDWGAVDGYHAPSRNRGNQ